MDLTNVSTEELETEIRKRRLAQKCAGRLIISEHGKKAVFALTSVPWPDGEYTIAVECLKDLTNSEPESDLNNESQR